MRVPPLRPVYWPEEMTEQGVFFVQANSDAGAVTDECMLSGSASDAVLTGLSKGGPGTVRWRMLGHVVAGRAE